MRVGLLTVDQPDQLGLETFSLAEVGQARYEQLSKYKRQQDEPVALTE